MGTPRENVISFRALLKQSNTEKWCSFSGIRISYEGSFNSTQMGRCQRLIIGWIITSALNFLVSAYDFVVL